MAGDDSGTGKAARARAQGRPSLSEAEAIARSLREAAMQALLEQGDAATMNGIAQRAGISRKALYARYANRSDLFADIIRTMLAEVEPLPTLQGGSVEERLSAFIADALAMLGRPQSRAVQRLIAIDSFYLGNLRREMQQATSRMFFEPLRGLVEEASREGLMRHEDPEAIARVVLRMIFAHGLFDGGVPGGEGSDAEARAHAALVREIILNGMIAR